MPPPPSACSCTRRCLSRLRRSPRRRRGSRVARRRPRRSHYRKRIGPCRDHTHRGSSTRHRRSGPCCHTYARRAGRAEREGGEGLRVRFTSMGVPTPVLLACGDAWHPIALVRSYSRGEIDPRRAAGTAPLGAVGALVARPALALAGDAARAVARAAVVALCRCGHHHQERQQ